MKIMSILRWICLFPFVVLFGLWYLIKLMLGLIVLVLLAWLIHALFGIAGDVVLALPIVYVLSYLLPNPKIMDIGKICLFKGKRPLIAKSNLTNKVVDFDAHRLRIKRE